MCLGNFDKKSKPIICASDRWEAYEKKTCLGTL